MDFLWENLLKTKVFVIKYNNNTIVFKTNSIYMKYMDTSVRNIHYPTRLSNNNMSGDVHWWWWIGVPQDSGNMWRQLSSSSGVLSGNTCGMKIGWERCWIRSRWSRSHWSTSEQKLQSVEEYDVENKSSKSRLASSVCSGWVSLDNGKSWNGDVICFGVGKMPQKTEASGCMYAISDTFLLLESRLKSCSSYTTGKGIRPGKFGAWLVHILALPTMSELFSIVNINKYLNLRINFAISRKCGDVGLCYCIYTDHEAIIVTVDCTSLTLHGDLSLIERLIDLHWSG